MENDRGDLADIVRAAGSRSGPPHANFDPVVSRCHLPSQPVVFPERTEAPTNNSGEYLLNLRDPLPDQYTGVEFFYGAEAMVAPAKTDTDRSSDHGGGWRPLVSPELQSGEQENDRPCNNFSRVLQISPGGSRRPFPLSPRLMKPSPAVAREMMMTKLMNVSSSSAAGPVDHGGGVQILCPQTPGVKRRKSQAKKVVCIPAPAAATSRPTGEVVPSDLWAWRKYGQKPIKGSPYPRGYYRCSSSKGCSARKQVERSRTDPNMLVITYTSEHNHPWPTQRNALAGSTRSHPFKNALKIPGDDVLKSPTAPKEERREATTSNAHLDLEQEQEEEEMDKPTEDDDFNQNMHRSYKPMIPEADQPDDFFADLAELETDPMSLIFSKGYMDAKPDEERGHKASDTMDMFDWAGSS